MEEQFHLDLQIAKFTEFGVCMVFPGAADLDHLRNNSEKMVEVDSPLSRRSTRRSRYS